MSEQTDQLAAIVTELRSTADRAKQQPLWKSAFNLLKKLPVDQNRAANIVAGRNLEALAAMLADLRGAEEPPAEVAGAIPDHIQVATTHDAQDEETLKAALKAFRRRLKFAKLDEESRLGRGPIGSGHRIQSMSIEPPNEYPKSIWDALVKRGELKATGQGFYQLAKDEP